MNENVCMETFSEYMALFSQYLININLDDLDNYNMVNLDLILYPFPKKL